MNELRKDLLGFLDELNQVWISTIQEAESGDGGIDMKQVISNFSKIAVKLDTALTDLQKRHPRWK